MTVTVPENRSTRGGRRVQLSVILVPASNPQARGAPIVILPGGPGGEITGQAAAWSRFLREVRGDHPLLFMDPRGTGSSSPLDCEFTNPERMSGHVRDFLPPDHVRRCRQALSARADLTQYTSEQVAQDLDDVRAALGFERLIPYGTSGGTRLSLMYLKRFPQRVEAMILAGMVPLSFRMPMHYAPDTDAAFDSLVAACDAEVRCARAYPRLRQRTDSLLRALARRPVVVALPFVDGRDSARISAGIFAERLRTLMYNSETAASIPYIVDRASKGEFQPFV
ncbi:MAG TPA: alpha/beta fold hydrolase, partial [Gemmatimonadaceae bacterium]|nr:alpha/beta fold hydrolase [Gemmatimonadaceae bacterium]